MVYVSLRLSNTTCILGSQEQRALWRSVSYKSRNRIRDDNDDAKVVSKMFLSAVRDFVPTLLPRGTVGNTPAMSSVFNLVNNAVLDAITLQNHIRTECLSNDWEIFLPSPLTPYDPSFMTLIDAKVPDGPKASWGLDTGSKMTIERDMLVLVASGLGLRIVAGRGQDSNMGVKASVICRYKDH